MYLLNKIVGFVISPTGGVIAGCVVSLAFVWFRRVRLAKLIGGITFVWLWMWMTPVMTGIVGAPLEKAFLVDGRVPPIETFPDADAIVLLGGSMDSNEMLSPYAEMWTSADRVWQTARLWKAGKAPKIIATGNGAKRSTLGLLKEMGVDEKCVEFLDARNTEEEARGVGDLLTQRSRDAEKQRDLEVGLGSGAAADASAQKNSASPPLSAPASFGVFASPRVANPRKGRLRLSALKNRKILLVTSAWHMKRARMMFEKYAEGVEVVCAPADFENMMTVKRACWRKMLLPDTYVFHLNSAALHEWVGLVGYRLFR